MKLPRPGAKEDSASLVASLCLSAAQPLEAIAGTAVDNPVGTTAVDDPVATKSFMEKLMDPIRSLGSFVTNWPDTEWLKAMAQEMMKAYKSVSPVNDWLENLPRQDIESEDALFIAVAKVMCDPVFDRKLMEFADSFYLFAKRHRREKLYVPKEWKAYEQWRDWADQHSADRHFWPWVASMRDYQQWDPVSKLTTLWYLKDTNQLDKYRAIDVAGGSTERLKVLETCRAAKQLLTSSLSDAAKGEVGNLLAQTMHELHTSYDNQVDRDVAAAFVGESATIPMWTEDELAVLNGLNPVDRHAVVYAVACGNQGKSLNMELKYKLQMFPRLRLQAPTNFPCAA